jgi:4-amino-4-deoxy-L-arabinose transferase-like glycosyltransferase
LLEVLQKRLETSTRTALIGMSSLTGAGAAIEASDGQRDEKRDDKRYVTIFFAVILILTALRILALAVNATDLYTDEAQYWVWGQEPAFGYYSKPPLLALILTATSTVCGDSEFCTRLPSPLFYLVASAAVYFTAAKLYSHRIAFWSALAFATLPGISLSSQISSTDVPLLLLWSLALLVLVRLLERPTFALAILLGLSIGIGLNAKYAMAYFVLCAVIYAALAPSAFSRVRWAHLLCASVVVMALITPNLVWNANHSFATFVHTSDNAKWQGSLFHPDKAAAFLGAQFGVFGPILFGALLTLLLGYARGRERPAKQDLLLLAFSVPIIAIVTVQGFLSRAHENWAATAYVAASILVVAALIRNGATTWLRASFAVNLAVMGLVAVGGAFAGQFRLPGGHDPFARTLGNREIAAIVREAVRSGNLNGSPFAAILSDERGTSAALLYYGRDLRVPLYEWRGDGRPKNHFQLTRPYGPSAPRPVLLVSVSPEPKEITSSFTDVRSIGTRDVKAGQFTTRKAYLFYLDGLKVEK